MIKRRLRGNERHRSVEKFWLEGSQILQVKIWPSIKGTVFVGGHLEQFLPFPIKVLSRPDWGYWWRKSNLSPTSMLLKHNSRPTTSFKTAYIFFSVRTIWKRSLSNFKLTKLKMKKNMLNGKLVVKLGKNHMPIILIKNYSISIMKRYSYLSIKSYASQIDIKSCSEIHQSTCGQIT